METLYQIAHSVSSTQYAFSLVFLTHSLNDDASGLLLAGAGSNLSDTAPALFCAGAGILIIIGLSAAIVARWSDDVLEQRYKDLIDD